MDSRRDIPEDPTRPLRQAGIRQTVARAKAILREYGKMDLTQTEIAAEARLRIERSKPGPAVEHAAMSAKHNDSE